MKFGKEDFSETVVLANKRVATSNSNEQIITITTVSGKSFLIVAPSPSPSSPATVAKPSSSATVAKPSPSPTVATLKELIQTQLKVLPKYQVLLKDNAVLADEDAVKPGWSELSLVVLPGREFEVVIYFYAFYKMKIKETWTVQNIIDKLAQHTNTSAGSIQLYKDGTLIREYFGNRDSMKASDYVTSQGLGEGSKIRAFTVVHLHEGVKALIMDKDDTVASLTQRVQKKMGARVREVKYREESLGELSNKDKLVELKSDGLTVKFWSSNNDNIVKLV